MLELRNICKNYKNNIALKNINLSFNEKEFVSIIGPSGCGKTTLLNIVGGLDKYSSGDLLIDRQSTSNYSSRDWDGYRNNRIGFIFQNYNLINHLTVFDNVEIALTLKGINRKKRIRLVKDVITKVGLSEHINKLPSTLSGGEQQRVAIARAIVNNPDIILADEPTGALDTKNASLIMELIKEVSKDKLVIMVTHNYDLALKYSSRIIKLKDGEVIEDSCPVTINNNKLAVRKKEKQSMKKLAAVKLSFKNLLTKKLRTSLTILAGSIGIIGLSLVMMFSNIVSNYMEDLQKNTLSNYPITINSTIDNTDPFKEDTDYPLYPNHDKIIVVNEMSSYYGHVNKFDEEFLNYVDNLDKSLYNVINYSTGLDLKLLTETEGKIKKIDAGNFIEVSDDLDYLETQYDVLAGSFPTKENELAILIDKYNKIDIRVLNSLGIDYLGIDEYTFDEIQQKVYKLISNNDFYIKDANTLTYRDPRISEYQGLYDKTFFTLKISGIIRVSKTASLDLYRSGILYSKKLTNKVVIDAKKSDIVIEQMGYGLTKDVRTNLEFRDQVSMYSNVTKEYQYESWLAELCVYPKINSISIYTDLFRSRVKINEYLENYNKTKESENKIMYFDRMGSITVEFDAFISILTTILMIFSLISLLVSSIMTGIITYVSVVERTKEIGILRSIGARKIDIAFVVNTESGLIGLVSGVIGVILGVVLLKPVINIITNMLKENNIKTFDLTLLNTNQVEMYFLVFVVIGSIILSLIAGAIPAIIASRKNPVNAIRVE